MPPKLTVDIPDMTVSRWFWLTHTHLPFQTYHPGHGLFSHLAHFWWPTPSPVLPECYCSRRCLSPLPQFAFFFFLKHHRDIMVIGTRLRGQNGSIIKKPKSHKNKFRVWCRERGAAADAAIRNSSSALIRTPCHQVRCWKDVECVEPFPGSVDNVNVCTNRVNTKTRWQREVFCEVASTQGPKRVWNLMQLLPLASCFIFR